MSVIFSQGREASPKPSLISLTAIVLLLLVWNATAHPLGQESVDRFARLDVTPSKIIVVYDLNMAEQATARELPILDADHDGIYEDAEKQAYAADLARRTTANLKLEINGQPLALNPVKPKVFLTPGEGGLPTLRLIMTLETLPGELTKVLSGSERQIVSFRDANSPGVVGWRQIGAEGLGTTISETAINGHPATASPQGYLTDIPGEQTNACQASFRFMIKPKESFQLRHD